MRNKEIWKDIKDYEGLYQISNLGRIKILQRTSYRQWTDGRREVRKKQKISIISKRDNVYLITKLCKNKVYEDVYIHRLVAESFIPNPENKPFINHIDNNPSNNKVENLEWCTQKENMQHSVKNGNFLSKRPRSENHYASKLTNNQVIMIRMLKQYATNKRIAEIFKVSPKIIWGILNNKTYKLI